MPEPISQSKDAEAESPVGLGLFYLSRDGQFRIMPITWAELEGDKPDAQDTATGH
jgi:hypothetical protein